jgi:hypothetical protein
VRRGSFVTAYTVGVQRALASILVLASTLAFAQPQAKAEPAQPSVTTFRQRRRVYIAYALGATGAASLITSGVLAVVARQQYHRAFDGDHCFEGPEHSICDVEGKQATDAARNKADIATGFLIAGAALGAAGIVVYLTAPKEHGVAVTPVATSSTVGAQLQLSF